MNVRWLITQINIFSGQPHWGGQEPIKTSVWKLSLFNQTQELYKTRWQWLTLEQSTAWNFRFHSIWSFLGQGTAHLSNVLFGLFPETWSHHADLPATASSQVLGVWAGAITPRLSTENLFSSIVVWFCFSFVFFLLFSLNSLVLLNQMFLRNADWPLTWAQVVCNSSRKLTTSAPMSFPLARALGNVWEQTL